MKIEAGKFYRTRGGKKVRVYAVDGGGEFQIHGAVLLDGTWYVRVFKLSGRSRCDDALDSCDLVSEWVDKPVVDWSKLAAWHRWVARDEDGSWYVYAKRPELASASWKGETNEHQRIPQNYSPTFSGDWKDSLVERPTE